MSRPYTAGMQAAGVAARVAAARALAAVLDKKQDLDQALHLAFQNQKLEGRDRGFAHLMVGYVLRHLPRLDAAIAAFMTQEKPLSPPMLAHVLRLGLAQLWLADVPPHAAVSATVDAAVVLGLNRQKNLVNALLRRAGREGPHVLPPVDASAHFPLWMTQGWAENFGAEHVAAIATASLTQAPLDLCLRDDTQTDEYVSLLGGISFGPGHVRLPDASGVSVPELPGYAEGAWWVQDFAASLPVRLMGDVSGMVVADLCAAPGGKTMQLAARGAKVIAVDRSARRLEILNRNLNRTGLAGQVQVEVADAVTWRPSEPLDAILLDAPCTATGTMRRHPELPYLRGDEDMESLRALQAELLDHAAGLLRQGGVLVYCTCSLQPQEGIMQQSRFMEAHNDFVLRRNDLKNQFKSLNFNNSEASLRLIPDMLADQGGMDGFFAFCAQKNTATR